MDYTPAVSAIQGLFVSADNVYSFSRLTAKGGNEEKFEYIINSVLKFLEEGNYINKNGIIESSVTNLRPIVFYIILNADLEALRDITDFDELEIFIWAVPTIPKCLMCELFWKLHLDRFVYELIAYCSPRLSLELAATFIDNIKYYSPNEYLNKLKLVTTATHQLICRLHLFNYKENVLSYKLTGALNSFQKCLNYFTNPPKAEKLNNLTKDELYKYKGYCLHTMLLIIKECMEQYTQIPELYPNDIGELYAMTYESEPSINLVTFTVSDSPNTTILDCLKKCYIALLDKFQQLVMDVSVDIFCAWSEFTLNGRSMQQKIGQLCYETRIKLLNVTSISDHPVINMIQQISCKPVHWKDLMETSDSAAIIESINNNSEDKAACLLALTHKKNLFQDNNLIKCLISNLEHLNEEACCELFKNIENHMYSDPENNEILEELAIKSFQRCNILKKQEMLAEHFSNNIFIDMTENSEFNSMLMEIFNKLILSPESDMSDILTVFLQNPRRVYKEIFNLAAENIQQTNIMLEVMKVLYKYSSHYYNSDTEPCIVLVVQECFDNFVQPKIETLLKFLCNLKSCNCITGPKLLLLIIMPKLHKALIDRDLECLYIQSKLLYEAYSLEELLEYRAPLLAMLAQMLDVVRWKITTFEPAAPKALQIILQLQITLFDTYSSGIPDNESNWLKSKLKHMQPLNMYYYRKLWNPPGNNFLEIICGKQIHDEMDKEQLATWLSQILCSTNQHEWSDMWDSLTVFPQEAMLDIFHDAMSLLTIAERANSTQKTWQCLQYCYRNFIFIIRYKFFKEPLSDTQVTSVINKIEITTNLMEESHLEVLGTILLPLFAYMAERKNDYSINLSQYIHNKLRHSKFADTVKKAFTNGAI
ncbi:uncharacterized protein LOC113522787 [Galleria mellonella]|uniref:Uncharacterized protein LOC113522787 n=1 Tax=Galleria mellonella TaxID=7137 RepID=A0A6J1X936_GALME|nr:uncharacterized protein LOC113522787 [Galleria mellonella]